MCDTVQVFAASSAHPNHDLRNKARDKEDHNHTLSKLYGTVHLHMLVGAASLK